MTDSELIARVLASRDHAAFAALVRGHQSAVRHFLRHLTRGDFALADDLAQETFLCAWRGLERFRGTASFSTWLLGIAHNQWRNARRRQHTVAIESATSEPPEPVEPTTGLSDLQHDLGLALRTLVPDQQTVLHLCYHQGLSHAEIAHVLEWPLGTVKTHLNRAKEKLRPLLASWNPQV